MPPSALADYVKVVTATLGTGAITLGAAVPGFRGKEGLIDGLQFSYAIAQPDFSFELGRGAYDGTAGILSRGPLHSSNADAAITLAGQAVVSIVLLAEDFEGWLQTAQNTFTGMSWDVTSGPLQLVPGYNGIANKTGGILSCLLPAPAWDGELVEVKDEAAYTTGAAAAGAFAFNIMDNLTQAGTVNANGDFLRLRYSFARAAWVANI